MHIQCVCVCVCVCVHDNFHIETNFIHLYIFVKNHVSQINTQDFGSKICFIDYNLIYSTWKWRHVTGCFWWVIILRPRSCVFGFIWYIVVRTGDIVLVQVYTMKLCPASLPHERWYQRRGGQAKQWAVTCWDVGDGCVCVIGVCSQSHRLFVSKTLAGE